MSRNLYADDRQQRFWKDAIEKESKSRLIAFAKLRGHSHSKSRQLEVLRKRIEDSTPSDALLERLPSIRTETRYNKHAPDLKSGRVSDKALEEVWKDLPDMRAVSPLLVKTLYDGFSREGKGRYHYLRQRYDKIPEEKFIFPVCTSWDYGWRLNDASDKNDVKRSFHGRNNIINATFYSRSGFDDGCRKAH